MRHSKSLTIFLLFYLLGTAAPAQESRRLNLEQEAERDRVQALSMIRQTANEALVWKSKKAAVQVLTDAADLLWNENADQAAVWLKKAWAMLDEVSSSPKDDRLREFFTRSDQTELRTSVLSIARRHDAKLANQFLKELSEKQSEETKRGAFDDRTARSEQLLSIAQQVLDSNPEEALTLAENSLTDGISFSLQNVLTGLRKKSVPLANRLFDVALARFNSTRPDPSEAQVLSGYLFQSGITFSATSSGQRIMALNPAQQNLPMVASSEPERAHRFLVLVYERLLTRPVVVDSAGSRNEADQLLLLGELIARRYPLFAPELTESVQGFLTLLRQQVAPDTQSSSTNIGSQKTSASQDTTKTLTEEESYQKRISELEEGADREKNPSFRDVAYIKVAVATKPTDYVLAKRIAEKISDRDLRADAISFVLYRAALSFVSNSEIEKAADLAPAINDVLRRAVVRIVIAQHLLSTKVSSAGPNELSFVQQRALDLLTDTDRDLRKTESTANKARILLGKTAVLARLDKDQALVSLEQAIQTINKVDEFDLRNSAAPNLGLGSLSASAATVKIPKIGFDFRSVIDSLEGLHFDDLAAISQRFTEKEMAGVARMETAKLFLRKQATQSH